MNGTHPLINIETMGGQGGRPVTFPSSPPSVPSSWGAVFVYRWASEAQMELDVPNLPAWITVGMYDNEDNTTQFPLTPANEIADPATYYARAAALLHARGKAFLATSGIRQFASQNQSANAAVYATAAQWDGYAMQTQMYSSDLQKYSNGISDFVQHLLSANPKIAYFIAGLSDCAGSTSMTLAQIQAAAAATPVDFGIWGNFGPHPPCNQQADPAMYAALIKATESSPYPSPSPTPTPPLHVQTLFFGQGWGCGGVLACPTVPMSFFAQYGTLGFFSESGPQYYDEQAKAAGVGSIVYTNFWRAYASDNPLIAYNELKPGGIHAAAEAKDCSGKPIMDPSYGGGYQNDPRSFSDALGLANDSLLYRLGEYTRNGKTFYDAWFGDDTDTTISLSGVPCGFDPTAWVNASSAVFAGLKTSTPGFINALNTNMGDQVATSAWPANVRGAECESCLLDQTPVTGASWVSQENRLLNVVRNGHIGITYVKATAPTIAQRIYAYASYLLTYDVQHSMFITGYSSPTGVTIMPEVTFVPLDPLSTANDVSQYLSGGVYVRQWAHCALAQRDLGPCAVVVNPGATTVAMPPLGLAHQLWMSGGSIFDGGSASIDSPAPTNLGPGGAAVLTP